MAARLRRDGAVNTVHNTCSQLAEPMLTHVMYQEFKEHSGKLAYSESEMTSQTVSNPEESVLTSRE